MQQYEKEVDDSTCSISSGNMIENDEEMNEGDKTPVKGPKISMNFMQQKLNKALPILSPVKKMENMRKQAKLNIKAKLQKLIEAMQKKQKIIDVKMQETNEINQS